ncbi:hypothetical protein SH2C18_22380 [Clostridium sediminicola]|uniref:hydrogen gas-evolving membrane-bound hydrogenase subunit E n=1 Tax=Clostridium sediminicola TaxID=3114879 RepID=UPI0031F21E7F
MEDKNSIRKMLIASYIIIIASVTLYLYYRSMESFPNEIVNYYLNNALKDTGAENVVTAIYLNYRLYDTFFEALMLLISVIGIIHFSRHDSNSHIEPVKETGVVTWEDSQLISIIGGFLFPFIMIFGSYIIFNGHRSPGGGFQGGAVLASVFIIKFLVSQTHNISLNFLHKAEKVLFILIILIGVGYLFLGINVGNGYLNEYYLVLMNSLIGMKVFCGLSIIFFRFVFYESR